jgi:hypothetical protein
MSTGRQPDETLTERVDRLFQQTGLGNPRVRHKCSTLATVDRMHFRHVLRAAPSESLIEPFRLMKTGMAVLSLSDDDAAMEAMEQQLCPMVDLLVAEIISSAQEGGRPLPYGHPDWLWRRIAFAAITVAQMQQTETVMPNVLLMKVAKMIHGPGGPSRLDKLVREHGFEPAIGEPQQ